MTKIVETDLSDDGLRPEAVAVLGAATLPVFGCALLMRARLLAAYVLVVLHNASTSERAAEHFFERRVLAHHLAVVAREHEVALRTTNRGLEVRSQLGCDRDCCRALPFGRVACVRTADIEQARAEVHVGLPEPRQFALAQACVDSGREQRAMPVREDREHPRHLIRLQEIREPLRDFSSLDFQRRIRAAPAAGALRLVERRGKVRTQVIQAVRRQLVGEALKVTFDLTGRHFDQPQRSELRVDEAQVHY